MIELRRIAQDEVLRDFLSYPPRAFSPENGVIGAALSYDPGLVTEVERAVTSDTSFPSDTVEYSTVVAGILASVAGFGGPELPDASITGKLKRLWLETSKRRFDRWVMPVRIELTVTNEFPRFDTLFDRFDRWKDSGGSYFFKDWRIVFRQVHHSKLQFAEAGGRVIPLPHKQSRFGTLGGILKRDPKCFVGATAAHVIDQSASAIGTRAFLAGHRLGVRSLLQKTSGYLGRANWLGQELGDVVRTSPPDIVPEGMCSLQQSPQTKGLDFAVLDLPHTQQPRLVRSSAVSVGEVSPALQAWFIGAASGPVLVRVASYTIWQAYRLAGVGSPVACIGDCFQIALRKRPYVQTDVSQGGDSGSWLMVNSLDGPRWLGMLVGGDGERAGVVPAQKILDYVGLDYTPMVSQTSF
jgi:hypothetical protein